MNREAIARQILYGLRKHGLETSFNALAFNDLPHEFRDQLLDIAGMVPQDDPFGELAKLRAWFIKSQNWQARQSLDRYLDMINQRRDPQREKNQRLKT